MSHSEEHNDQWGEAEKLWGQDLMSWVAAAVTGEMGGGLDDIGLNGWVVAEGEVVSDTEELTKTKQMTTPV